MTKWKFMRSMTHNNWTKLESYGHSGTVEASMLRIEVAASTP